MPSDWKKAVMIPILKPNKPKKFLISIQTHSSNISNGQNPRKDDYYKTELLFGKKPSNLTMSKWIQEKQISNSTDNENRAGNKGSIQ